MSLTLLSRNNFQRSPALRADEAEGKAGRRSNPTRKLLHCLSVFSDRNHSQPAPGDRTDGPDKLLSTSPQTPDFIQIGRLSSRHLPAHRASLIYTFYICLTIYTPRSNLGTKRFVYIAGDDSLLRIKKLGSLSAWLALN